MDITINRVKINLEKANDLDVAQLAGQEQSSGDKPNGVNGYAMVMPVQLRVPGGVFWTIPVDPLVSISGGNVIAKRTVAKSKGRGTIKERWSQDDYQVNIEGVLINYADANNYPEADVKKLRELLEARQALEIECDLCKHFDISRITIESWDIPFTSGEANQRYSISAISDDMFDLLVEDVKPLST